MIAQDFQAPMGKTKPGAGGTWSAHLDDATGSALQKLQDRTGYKRSALLGALLRALVGTDTGIEPQTALRALDEVSPGWRERLLDAVPPASQPDVAQLAAEVAELRRELDNLREDLRSNRGR